MSYILEALRKSERERQTGQVPSLSALVPEPPPRRVSWVLWLVLVLLVLNGAGLAYFWLNSRSGTTPAPPPIAHIQPAPSADIAPNTTIAAVEPPPAVPKPIKPAAPIPRPVPKPPVARPAKPAPKSPILAKDEATPDSEDAMPAPPVQWPPIAPPISPRPAPVATGKEDTLPWFDTLPASFQQRMMPFRITLFAYSSIPEERFAIINARKYRVGDLVPGDARLLEIRADSLILELEGLKFRIPRP